MITSLKWRTNDAENRIILAALKVIELMSFKNNNEFNLYKWAFVFEHFGV